MHKCVKSETVKDMTVYPACSVCIFCMRGDRRPKTPGSEKDTVYFSPHKAVAREILALVPPVPTGRSEKGQMFTYEGSGLHHKEGTPKSGGSEFCFSLFFALLSYFPWKGQ